MKTEEITYHYEDKNYIGFVAYPDKELAPLVPVSYTHLTLPTIYSV